MATELKKERTINLLGKDFAANKQSLITYAQSYASGTFTDYNESSPGMTWLEFSAFIGDTLSFYIDQCFNESRDSTAVQPENVMALAKMRGYRPSGKRAAHADVWWALEVPAAADQFGTLGPDDRYTPQLSKGSQSNSKSGMVFETLDSIDFTASLGREVTGSRFDATTGLPTYFAIRKSVEMVAGKTVIESFPITDFQQFRKVDLSEPDVIEVIDVIDSQGNVWYEVDYLAQDWVFIDQVNSADDADQVPYIMRLLTVPRRFVVDTNIVTGKSKMVFGSGDGLSFDDELVPNVADYSLPLAGRRTYGSFAIDPQNFLKTMALGLSPHNTTLTVRYRVGGGVESNVPERSITQPTAANLIFYSNGLDPVTLGQVEGSVGCLNFEASSGGAPAETIREMKLNAAAYFAAQQRVVTREDVVARVLSMPAKFGRPEKVFVKPSVSRFSYDVHVLSLDSDGLLSKATPTLKSNVSTYLQKFKMLTDSVNILDGRIIDLRCHIGVSIAPSYNKSEVLSTCLDLLGDYFSIDRMQIGQPIVISDIISQLQDVVGVTAVFDVSFRNVFGVQDSYVYSDDRFDISDSLKDGMLICPSESIFQIKFPKKDIVGVAR